MRLNTEQANALRTYLTTNQNIMVLASAGTGKTTLLRAMAVKQKQPGSHVYVAFTNAAKAVMQSKMPQANVKTTYSLGMMSLRSLIEDIEVDKFKASNNFDTLVLGGWGDNYLRMVGLPYPDNPIDLKNDVLKLASKSLLATLISQDEILHFGQTESFKVLDMEGPSGEWAADLAAQLIKTGYTQMMEDSVIDFQEMIAWPAMLDDIEPMVYHEVFIDECQDLSMAQIKLLEKSLAPGGQLVAVGDKLQSIYAFAGAYSSSLDVIKETFNCITMPLVVNYRCGKAIIEYAQEIDPKIRAHDGASDGQILSLPPEDAYLYARSNPKETWFLCRTNAELIKIGLLMVTEGIQFRYQRDVLEDRLTGLVSKFEYAQGGPRVARGRWGLFMSWVDTEIAKAKERRAINRLDLLEAIKLFFRKYRPESAAKFKTAIKRFFKSHSAKSKITLSTIHAAKGTEANTVIYWGTDMVPHPMAVTQVELEQERNLEHIVRTRAIETLILVTLGTQDHP
jgi:superfamily I DNA/RNA helicase